MPMFSVGNMVVIQGEEYQVSEFLGVLGGRETYIVTSATVRNINGYLTNQFEVQVVPTLVITGVKK